MTTRAEIAQDLFTNLLAFVERKLQGKEALIARTPLGGYVERMRSLDIATCAMLAQAGFLSWPAIEPRLIQPMQKLGIVLTAEETEFVKESLDGLTTLFAC